MFSELPFSRFLMNVSALSILFLALPLNAVASEISCSSLSDILERKPANKELETIESLTYVRWHEEKDFKKCKWDSIKKLTSCGSKRFVAAPEDLMLGFEVITKSGAEIGSHAFRNGGTKTTCYLTSNGYKRVAVSERIMRIDESSILYTVRKVETQKAPFSSMQF